MQGPTHLIVGVLIQQSMKKVRPRFRYPFIAGLALASHFLLDKFSIFTYHPPDPLFDDWFWISYHALIAVLTFFLLMKYWHSFAFGIIFSILPDIEWIVLYGSRILSFKVPFWTEPILHNTILNLLSFLPPFSLMDTPPDWRLKPIAAGVEFIILVALLARIWILQRREALSTTASINKMQSSSSKANVEIN